MHTLVAEAADEVVAFANLGAAREDDAVGLGELFSIYVLPEASGHGVGRALMTETLARLRAEGFAEAILWVIEDNPRTRRFYELAGWHVNGGVKDEEWLGTSVREVRYRIALEPGA
jgi:ribosomal protein S18 acetylase RimI-like enzyme